MTASTHRTTSTPLTTPPHLLSQFTAPLASRLYSRQYAALYDFRLRKLRRGRLLDKAKRKWEEADRSTSGSGTSASGSSSSSATPPKPTYTPRILDVKTGKVTYITGIIYVEMKLKPDVLQDLTREQYLPPLPPVTSYADPTSDHIYVEDESGRLKLIGPILTDEQHQGQWVTGTVGAFLGTELENGEFHVLEVCWPGLASVSGANKRVKLDSANAEKKSFCQDNDDEEDRPDDTYAVLLSGLDLGSNPTNGTDEDEAHLGFAAAEARMSLLTEWISGEIGDEQHRSIASRIAGVVIAGNLLSVQKADGSLFNAPPDTNEPRNSNKNSAAKMTSRANASLTPTPPSVLLSHLVQLSSSLPVVLLPGASDPVSAALPQQSIHRAVLRGADEWGGSPSHGGISLYNNPSWVQFGTTNLLCTSGQPLDDLAKYTPHGGSGESTTRTKIAHHLLNYGHMAPTCPDTLWCYPFTDRDPFIIGSDDHETIPDVFVIGNQPQFEDSVYVEGEGQSTIAVRVVLLPRFSVTGEVALLNLRSQKVRKVNIGWVQ